MAASTSDTAECTTRVYVSQSVVQVMMHDAFVTECEEVMGLLLGDVKVRNEMINFQIKKTYDIRK